MKISRKIPIRTRQSFADSSADEKEGKIEKTLEKLMSSQKELEQRLSQKIEDKLRLSHKSEEDSQARKLRELQAQIELLKKENDLAMTSKLEKELEIEKLRLSHRILPESQLLALQGMQPAFPAVPTYLPFTNYHPVYPPYPHSFGHPAHFQMGASVDLNQSIKSNPVLHSHPATNHNFLIRSRSVDQAANSISGEFPLENDDKNQSSSVSTNHDNTSTASNFGIRSKNASADSFTKAQSPQDTSEKNTQEIGKNKDEPINLETQTDSSRSLTHQHKQEQNPPTLERHVEKPIYKADTFGSAGLLSLVNDLKKSKLAAQNHNQHDNTETTASQTAKHGNQESPIDSKNTSVHTPQIFNSEKESVAQFANFTTAVERQQKSLDPGKPILSGEQLTPTNEVNEYQEHSGTQHGNSKDSAECNEKKKSPELFRRDSLKSILLTQKNNFSLSRVDFDFGEDSIDYRLQPKKQNTSLSIFNGHDDILESPKPCDLLFVNDAFPLPETSIITKTCFEFSATEVFKLECILDRTIAADIKMKIVISKKSLKEESSYVPYACEIVSLKHLQKVLKHVEYLDILPLTASLKSIKTYADFIKYCVMPFVWVSRSF